MRRRSFWLLITGFLISPFLFARSVVTNFPLVIAVVGALVVGKLAAAETAGRAFRYPAIDRLTMWSLSLPQVAATLAAALVAFNTYDKAGHRLVDRSLLNVVFVLMLTTSILGPVLTERFAPRMLEREKETAQPPEAEKESG